MDDLFAAQYGDSGTLNWVQRGGGGYGENSYGITADDSGGVFIAGYFNTYAVFQTDSIHSATLSSYGYDDILVAKLGGTGTGVVTSNPSLKEPPVIRLYPNPSHTQFIIDIENLSASEVQITNVLGQEIMRHKIRNPKQETIDVSQLTPGLYFISLFADDATYTFKFVKE
jgi:hypothetical protein